MKNIELRKVPCGETFTAFGEEYVVLDHVDGGVLSIRKGVWKRAPFDRMKTAICLRRTFEKTSMIISNC